MKRKWQRVLSWILTLTMLISTFQGTGFTVNAAADYDPANTDVILQPDNDIDEANIEIVAGVEPGESVINVTLVKGYSGDIVLTAQQYETDVWVNLSGTEVFAPTDEEDLPKGIGAAQVVGGVATIPVTGSALVVGEEKSLNYLVYGKGDVPDNATEYVGEADWNWVYTQKVNFKVVDNIYSIAFPVGIASATVADTTITMTAGTAIASALQFSIDPGYAGTATWKLVKLDVESGEYVDVPASEIPAGLTFSADGKLSGTPTKVSTLVCFVEADTTGSDEEPNAKFYSPITLKVNAPEGDGIVANYIESNNATEESTWGTWNKESKILVLNMADNIPEAAPLTWTVYDVNNYIVPGAVWDIVDKDGDSVLTVENGKTYFKGMNTAVDAETATFSIWGMPNEVLDEAGYRIIATTYGVVAEYALTINIGRTMHVFDNRSGNPLGNLVEGDWAFYGSKKLNGDNANELVKEDYEETLFKTFYFKLGGAGVISEGDLQFKATNALVGADKAFADITEEKKITWELFEADTEEDFEWDEDAKARIFKKPAYATVKLNEATTVNGLTFDNTNGVLTIFGQANETLTANKDDKDQIYYNANKNIDGMPKAFILRATNDNELGNPQYSEKYGEYLLMIQFEGINNIAATNLNWSEADRTATDWKVSKVEGAGLVQVDKVVENTWYMYEKQVAPDYVINTSGTNKVVPISFTLKDANKFLDMTNVSVVTEDLEDTDPDYQKDGTGVEVNKGDGARFTVNNATISSLTKGKASKLECSIEPNPGLEARGIAYKARIVVYADQLPVEGIEIGRIYFTVANDFTLINEDGEVIETKLLDRNDWYVPAQYGIVGNETPIKTYSFDAGTYVAGNSIGKHKVTVTSSDSSNKPTFEGYGDGKLGVAIHELLPGLNKITFADRNYVEFGGTLAPTDWWDMSNYGEAGIAEDNPIAKPDLFYVTPVNGTEYVKYSLPLIARDTNDTMICYMAEFTIKPADLGLTLDGEEVKDGDKFSWHATEDNYAVDEKTASSVADRVFTITNPNEEDLKIWVQIGNGVEGTFGIANGKNLDDTPYLKEYTIKSGATENIVIRPNNLVDGTYESKIRVYGKTTDVDSYYLDKVLLQTIDLSFTVIDKNAHLIVEPEGEKIDGNIPDGRTFATARHITIGVGEEAAWNFKYEGGLLGTYQYAQFDLVQPGVDTGVKLDVYAEEITGNTNQTPYVYETTGLNGFGFQWDRTKGQLTTTGASVDTSASGEERDHFTICAQAKYGPKAEDVVYCYYIITVEPTDKAIVLTGQKKTLKATEGDVINEGLNTTASVKEIAVGRNLILETNEDTVIPMLTTITLKNESKVTMKDIKLSMLGIHKVGSGEVLDGTNNPFAGLSMENKTWDWTTPVYELGDIASGISVQFSVDVKALHFNDVDPGTYTALLKVTGADMKDQYVVVVLTVNAAPQLGGLNYKYTSTGTNVEIESNPSVLANYHRFAEGVEEKLTRQLDNPLVAHNFTPVAQADAPFTNAKANTLAGEKVKLGESLDLQLTALGCDGKVLRVTEAEYHWKETIPGSDASIAQSGFDLSLDGKITGTAAKPGTYYMTVQIYDKREDVDIKERYGYSDICIYVPGAVELDLRTQGTKNVLGADWKNEDLWIFDGAVAGEEVPANAAKEIVVTNTSTDTDATGLEVTIKDDPTISGLAGSADHFEAELSSKTIAAKGHATLIVKPKNANVKEGWYEAIVEISGDNCATVSFPVRWLVSRKLTVTIPSLDETKTRTGTKDYSLTLKADGAGIAYDLKGNLLMNDEPWWDAIVGAANNEDDYKQNVYWGLRIKNDTGSNEELIKLAEALKEMGFAVDVQLKPDGHSYDKGVVTNGITNESMIYVAVAANDKTAEQNRKDSRFNKLASALLTGGQNWSFTAVALVDPCFASVNSKVKVLPAQSAEMDITLQVIPSTDVYVKYDKDVVALADTYSGISTTEKVDKHKNLVALKADPDWTKTIADYEKVTSFTFRDQAEGYAQDAQLNSRTFTVYSELGLVPLRAEAKIVSEDRVTKSTYFDLVEAPANDKIVNHFREDDYNKETFTVKVHEKLAASDTPYTGILIISGIGFDDIEIPLSVTVSPRNYDIDVLGNAEMTDEGKMVVDDKYLTAIGEDGFETVAQFVNPENDGPTAPIGYLTTFAVGNKAVTITRVEEVDGPDADASVVALKDEKLALTLNNAIDKASTPDGTIDPAKNVAAPSYKDSDYQTVTLQVKSAKTVSSGSAYVRIVYKDEAKLGKESSKTVKVNYVVYANGIAYTTDPFQQVPYRMSGEVAQVSEGYTISGNVVTFTITNDDTHIGDASYALYNTTVTIDFAVNDGYDLFTVNGKNTKKGVVALDQKKIMPGETASFTVEPIEGLPAGNTAYFPNVTIKPENAVAKSQKLEFNVVRNDDFRTYAFTDGYKMLDGWKQRVEDTLLQMYNATTDGYVVMQHAHPGHAWNMNDGYDINLNSDEENDEHPDVWVYFDKDNRNMLTIVKLGNSDEGQYSNPIVNPSYSASSTKHEFKSMRFDVLETVTYRFIEGDEYINDYDMMTTQYKGGIVIDGVDYGPIDGLKYAVAFPSNGAGFKFLVPYGKTLGEAVVIIGTEYAYSDPFVEIKGYSGDKSLDVFMNTAEADHETVVTESVILKDRDLMPKFHTHSYYQEEQSLVVIGDKEANGKPVVTWEWIGSEADGYTGAKVTLHCKDPLCNDYEGSAIVYDEKAVITTPNPDPGSCTDGGFIAYKAEVTRTETNITYISENSAKHVGEVNRHEYEFDWDHVRFYNLTDFENAFAEVVKKCVAEHHDVNRDGLREVTVSSNKVEFVGTKPTCEADGEGYYNFIFEDSDIPAADIEAGKNIISSNKIVVDKLGHKWKAVSANFEGGSYAEKPKSASLNLVCQNDETHTYVLTVNSQGITEDRTEERVIYTAIGYYEDQQVEYSITYESHTEHEWSVSFNWVTVSVNLVDTKVSATATCLTGGEKVDLIVTVTEDVNGSIKTYTAKATDPNGKIWTDSKIIDLKTGEEVTHEHVWKFEKHNDVWDLDWTGTTSDNAVAKAKFRCTSGNEVEYVTVTSAPNGGIERKADNKKITYKATVAGLDGNTYKEAYTITFDKDGKPVDPVKPGAGEEEIEILDGHFVIIGLEAEYPYTGKKITPAFKVRDVDRDILLGEKTDYTVKFKNNKDKGEAIVSIKGKGNYKGTNAEAKFKIVDPLEYNNLTSDELATVKKIKKVNAGTLVYNGKKQYPASIVVSTKDAGEITMTLEDAEEGTYTSSNGDKTIALSIVNNVKKGTATVAATGADGKTKSKTFKIKAADISTVKVEVEEEATWGVKAQELRLNVTLGDDEIELAPGGDFKAKFTAKTAGENAGSVKLTGKGNFKGSTTASYTVNALELSEENIIIDTVLAKKGPKTKVTVVDNAGNKLKNKNHYNASVAVGEENEVTVTVTAGKKSGSNIDFGDEGVSASATAASQKLGKFSAKGLVKYYTGSPITLDEEDFSKITGTGTLDEDFKVVSYKNNIKKGNMIVTVQGIGNYSGVKTFKVKIAPKPFDQVVEQ